MDANSSRREPRPSAQKLQRVTLSVILGLLGACQLAAAPAPDGAFSTDAAIKVEASRVYIDPERRDRTAWGELTFVSGVELRSGDRRFGGLSGMVISENGRRLVAVSDTARWLAASITYDDEGVIEGLKDVTMAPMLGHDGKALAGKEGDAEAVVLGPGTRFHDSLPDGDVLVSFERNHRIWRYDLGARGFSAVPEAVPVPSGLAGAPSNRGLEALAPLADGRLLMLTEYALDGPTGDIRGWLATGDTFRPLTMKRDGLFHVTDMAVLPQGDVLVLQRRFTTIGGPGMKIVQVPRATVEENAILDGPTIVELKAAHTIDNMEALTARALADGRVSLLILSDDNFNALQRTLLLEFVYEP